MMAGMNEAFQKMEKVKSNYRQKMKELHENAERLTDEAERNKLIGK